jgi:hypothetical protein
MYVCVCVCVYVYMHAWMYVCVYVVVLWRMTMPFYILYPMKSVLPAFISLTTTSIALSTPFFHLIYFFSFFHWLSNLKSFEVIFLRPFFEDVHTKQDVLPKYHKELYFYINFSLIISFLTFYRCYCWYELKFHFQSQYFFPSNLPNLTPVCGNTIYYCVINTFFFLSVTLCPIIHCLILIWATTS